ncbi:hypothetical protein [Ornithinibacillus californiensis]|uniref:hypothetical protein n=1 Tax=Ornithinibacillus californiensis TaxID=161536 RepID=UPI001F1867FB|nr:hypothetical protein [Ornithinibacillus californiensis]
MTITTKTKFLSSTALSKELNMPTKAVFEILQTNGLIVRENNNWILTEDGKK